MRPLDVAQHRNKNYEETNSLYACYLIYIMNYYYYFFLFKKKQFFEEDILKKMRIDVFTCK